MTNTFLKAKHWQLFIIIFGIPMLATIIMTSSMAAKMSGFIEGEIDPAMMMGQVIAVTSSFMKAFGLIMTFTILTLWGWYWSVGTKLQEKIPQEAKMNVRKFAFFYVIGFLYSFFFVGLMVFIASYLPMIINGVFSLSALSWVMSILGVVHLLAIFAMFYCMYFVAKTIKTAEMQREMTFGNFVGEFLLIWFFPIGVWILQPRINALAEKDISSGGDEMGWLDEME